MVSRRGLVRLMGNGYMRYDTKGNHGDGKVHGVRILHSGMDWRFLDSSYTRIYTRGGG